MNVTDMAKKGLMALLSALVIVVVLFYAYINPVEVVEPVPDANSLDIELIFKETVDQLNRQDEVDNYLLAELNSGMYGFRINIGLIPVSK